MKRRTLFNLSITILITISLIVGYVGINENRVEAAKKRQIL